MTDRVVNRGMRFRLQALMIAVSVFSLYLAGYAALREPVVGFQSVTRFDAHGDVSIRVSAVNDPVYRFGGQLSSIVFSPIAWVDWQLRKDYWVERHWERVERKRVSN